MPFQGKRKWSVWKGEVKRLLEAGAAVTQWVRLWGLGGGGQRQVSESAALGYQNQREPIQWAGSLWGGICRHTQTKHCKRKRFRGALRAGPLHPPLSFLYVGGRLEGVIAKHWTMSSLPSFHERPKAHLSRISRQVRKSGTV